MTSINAINRHCPDHFLIESHSSQRNRLQTYAKVAAAAIGVLSAAVIGYLTYQAWTAQTSNVFPMQQVICSPCPAQKKLDLTPIMSQVTSSSNVLQKTALMQTGLTTIAAAATPVILMLSTQIDANHPHIARTINGGALTALVTGSYMAFRAWTTPTSQVSALSSTWMEQYPSQTIDGAKYVGNTAISCAKIVGNAGIISAKFVGNAGISSAKFVGNAGIISAKFVGNTGINVAKSVGNTGINVAKSVGNTGISWAKSVGNTGINVAKSVGNTGTRVYSVLPSSKTTLIASGILVPTGVMCYTVVKMFHTIGRITLGCF
jgi:hypothetical protein